MLIDRWPAPIIPCLYIQLVAVHRVMNENLAPSKASPIRFSPFVACLSSCFPYLNLDFTPVQHVLCAICACYSTATTHPNLLFVPPSLQSAH